MTITTTPAAISETADTIPGIHGFGRLNLEEWARLLENATPRPWKCVSAVDGTVLVTTTWAQIDEVVAAGVSTDDGYLLVEAPDAITRLMIGVSELSEQLTERDEQLAAAEWTTTELRNLVGQIRRQLDADVPDMETVAGLTQLLADATSNGVGDPAVPA